MFRKLYFFQGSAGEVHNRLFLEEHEDVSRWIGVIGLVGGIRIAPRSISVRDDKFCNQSASLGNGGLLGDSASASVDELKREDDGDPDSNVTTLDTGDFSPSSSTLSSRLCQSTINPRQFDVDDSYSDRETTRCSVYPSSIPTSQANTRASSPINHASLRPYFDLLASSQLTQFGVVLLDGLPSTAICVWCGFGRGNLMYASYPYSGNIVGHARGGRWAAQLWIGGSTRATQKFADRSN